MILRRSLKPDVLVVGAGPAGSALGCLLADRGIDAIVLDRALFPRPKPCGESVNPGAVAALGRLGLLDAVVSEQPATISGWMVHAEGGLAARGDYASESGPGLGISRGVFDHALVREARRRGADVREGHHVESVELMAGGRERAELIVRTQGDRFSIAPRLLVGADGLRSIIARRLDLVGRGPRLRKVSLTCRVAGKGPDRTSGAIHQGPDATVGMAPVHASEPLWNVTVVVRSERLGREVAQDSRAVFRRALACVPVEWIGVPRIVGGPWACGPFDWPTRAVTLENAVLVGDAAGYFDPFTGQGIHQALRAAELAAPRIAEVLATGCNDFDPLRRYQRALRREMRPVRAFQHVVESLFSRTGPRRLAVRGLRMAPWYADRVIHVAGDAAPLRSLSGLAWSTPPFRGTPV